MHLGASHGMGTLTRAAPGRAVSAAPWAALFGRHFLPAFRRRLWRPCPTAQLAHIQGMEATMSDLGPGYFNRPAALPLPSSERRAAWARCMPLVPQTLLPACPLVSRPGPRCFRLRTTSFTSPSLSPKAAAAAAAVAAALCAGARPSFGASGPGHGHGPELAN